MLCQDEATLVYLANLGCIEINPWHCRVGTLDSPDYVVLDLDPEDVSFDRVIETAQAIRKVVDRIGAEARCKTSGKRGLHIYIPFEARHGHDHAKHFAELIANIVVAVRPPSRVSFAAPVVGRGVSISITCRTVRANAGRCLFRPPVPGGDCFDAAQMDGGAAWARPRRFHRKDNAEAPWHRGRPLAAGSGAGH